MIDFLIQLVSGLPGEIATALLATFPVTELRAAIPVGITVFDLNPIRALFSALAGNVLPLIAIFLILPPLVRFAASHSPFLNRVLEKYFHYLENKYKKHYDQFGWLILLVFVAIPLPGSGVWTGSVLAILFDIKKSYSIPAILLGMITSGILVLLITQGALSALTFLL